MSIKDFKKQVVSNLSIDAAVQPLAPVITGYAISGSDDTALDPAGGQTILVNGSGFRPGATITMNNTSISVVTFVSVDQLSFTSPAMSAGTYSLFVVNTDSGAAILAPGIIYSTFPTWTTAQGTLGSYYETTAISETVEATGDAPITYTLVSGSLPSGATLASDGTITGTSPVDSSSTTYSFTIRADDAESQSSTRSFSLTINTDVVTWVTPSSGATIILDGSAYSQALSATDAAGYSVSYTANALPTGLTLSSGTISGTSTVEGTTTTLLTATAATTNRNATNTITWVVTLGDIYWKNVSLLLSGSTPTTTFINDASLNNSQLTIAGDTRPNNFNPYSEGYYSTYFSTNATSMYTTSSPAVAFGSGDFTIEFFIYGLTMQSTMYLFDGRPYAGFVNGVMPLIYIDGVYLKYSVNGTTVITGTPSPAIVAGNWYHIALSRVSGNTRLFCNGVQQGSTWSDSSVYLASNISLNTNAAAGSSSNGMVGYYSNVRVIKGTGLYTSNFTTPTSPLSVVSGTSFLACMSNRLTDISNNNFTLSVNNTPRVSSAHPFATPTTSSYYTMYSTDHSGTGLDGFFLQNNAGLQFGTGDFTIEMWVYGSPSLDTFDLIAINDRTAAGNWGLANHFKVIKWQSRWGTTTVAESPANTFTFGVWNHIAVVRISGTTKIYFNGTEVGSGADATNYAPSTSYTVMVGGSASSYYGNLQGLISNLRIVKGVGVYTGNFTVPASPLTATQSSGTNISAITSGQTTLLTSQSSTLIDNSSTASVITTNVNYQAQPIAVSPFTMTTSSTTVTSLGSAYFDGTGDYLTRGNINFASNPFTIEGWFYPTTLDVGRNFWGMDNGSNSNPKILMYVDSSSRLTVDFGNAGTTQFPVAASLSTYGLVVNQWHHIAVVRSDLTSTGFTLYINGINAGTGQVGTNLNTITANFNIGYIGEAYGNPFVGYINDFRITNGTALYTSNFLPPQAPLTPVTNTQLLTLQYNGGANNNGFVDQSSFNNIITRAGNTTQGTFSPYSQTGWSNYFDGSGDYLTVPTSTSLDFGSGDFTVEAWVYPNALSSDCFIVSASGSGGFFLGYSSSSTVGFGWGRNGVAWDYRVAGNASTNTWQHVAVTRSGTSMRLFVNGTQSGTTQTLSTSYNLGTTSTTIGSQGTNFYFNGYISNVRAVKGTAVYTSSFTPSVSPLSITANTSLLTCQSNRLVDNSINYGTITKSGDVSTHAFSPFGGIASTTTSYSYYYDGTDDRLTFPSSSAFNLGTTYTVEGWLYLKSYHATDWTRFVMISSNGSTNGWEIAYGPTGILDCGSPSGLGAIVNQNIVSGTTVPLFTWVHVAVSRDATSARMYANGVLIGSNASPATQTSGDVTLALGYDTVGSVAGQLNGYLSNVRIVKGTAVYTSAFTPPTSPLTTITNTVLLTCQSSQIVDNSTNNFAITINNNVKPVLFNPFGSTTTFQAEYSASVNGGSAYYDGTGDYLTIPATSQASTIRAGDFTWETWIYPVASNAFMLLYGTWNNSSNQWAFGYSHTGQWSRSARNYIYNGNYGSNECALYSTTELPLNVWSHIAWVRKSNTMYCYINGESQTLAAYNAGLTWSDSFTYTTGQLCGIGGTSNYTTMQSYLADMRYVQGTAMYSTIFTPPENSMTVTASTVFSLKGSNGGIIDYHGTNNLETVGNTQLASEDPYGGSYYSNYFDGTGDYLTLSHNTALSMGSSDFTVEFWIYSTSFATENKYVWFKRPSTSSGTGLGIGFEATTGKVKLLAGDSEVSAWEVNIVSTNAVSLSTWTHIAVTRNSSTWTVYINGVSNGTATASITVDDSSGTSYVGSASTTSGLIVGYVSNLRIVKGTALYTSTFTPSTTPLTAVAGTSLLTCQSNKFVDNSTNAFTITSNGDTKVKSMNPFQQNTGKSLYFDGTGDYLVSYNMDALRFGSGNFTMEFWFYPTKLNAAMVILSTKAGGTQSGDVWIATDYIGASSTILYIRGGGADFSVTYNGPLVNLWTNIAIVRNGANVYVYVNGTSIGSGVAGTQGSTNFAAINLGGGSGLPAAGYECVTGYIDDFRVTKGVARYTTTFTPPTSPLKNK